MLFSFLLSVSLKTKQKNKSVIFFSPQPILTPKAKPLTETTELQLEQDAERDFFFVLNFPDLG